MARIRKSSIITDLRGKLSGTSLQGGIYGLSMHAPRKRKKSITSKERKQLNNMAILAQYWRSLSLLQKQNWQLWSEWSNQHSKHNIAQIISGYTGFMKVNLPRLQFGFSIMPSAPLTNTVPVYSQMSLALTLSGLLALYSSVVIGVNENVIVKVSQSKQQGCNILKNECKSLPAVFNSGSMWDVQAYYVAIYGNAPVTGECIGLCWSQIDLNSGIRLPDTFKVFSL